MADVAIAELIASLGYLGEPAQRAAHEVLVDAGLTSGKKQRIDAAKVAAVRAVLERSLAPICGDTTCAADALRRSPQA